MDTAPEPRTIRITVETDVDPATAIAMHHLGGLLGAYPNAKGPAKFTAEQAGDTIMALACLKMLGEKHDETIAEFAKGGSDMPTAGEAFAVTCEDQEFTITFVFTETQDQRDAAENRRELSAALDKMAGRAPAKVREDTKRATNEDHHAFGALRCTDMYTRDPHAFVHIAKALGLGEHSSVRGIMKGAGIPE